MAEGYLISEAAARRIVRAVKAIEKWRRGPTVRPAGGGPSALWARITGSVADGDNRWLYAWEQVRHATAGYDGWSAVSGGLSGTTTARPARNCREVLEGSEGVQAIPAGVVVQLWFLPVGDDETADAEPWFVTSTPRAQVLFGKPAAAFSSGATITLDPCDVAGTDNGLDDRTVFVRADQSSYSMTNGTTIPTTEIVPHVMGPDGEYYMLGTPVEVVTTYRIDGANQKVQKKTRNVWLLTPGTESGWVDVHTGDLCP